MRIAVVSLSQIWEDKEANKTAIQEILSQTTQLGIDLFIFPEQTLTGFSMNTGYSLENVRHSPTLEFFRSLAIQNKAAVIFGMVIKRLGSRAKNSAVFISSNGERVGIYSKMHLFRFAGEDKHFASGNKVLAANFNGVSIGLSICYDLRFARFYERLAKKSDLLVNIANWPSVRRSHWEHLGRARAIENQRPFIGCNRIGEEPSGLSYEKTSFFLDANGIEIQPIVSMNQIDVFEFEVAVHGAQAAWVSSIGDATRRIPRVRKV